MFVCGGAVTDRSLSTRWDRTDKRFKMKKKKKRSNKITRLFFFSSFSSSSPSNLCSARVKRMQFVSCREVKHRVKASRFFISSNLVAVDISPKTKLNFLLFFFFFLFQARNLFLYEKYLEPPTNSKLLNSTAGRWRREESYFGPRSFVTRWSSQNHAKHERATKAGFQVIYHCTAVAVATNANGAPLSKVCCSFVNAKK